MDIYNAAIEHNEASRANLPKVTEEEYEYKIYPQIRTYEDVTFILQDAASAYAQDQGIFD